jgi:hypothetical protein
MSFIIQGLDPILFGSLFEQKQANYKALPVERYEVTQSPGFPCRVTLDDAGIGEIVLLSPRAAPLPLIILTKFRQLWRGENCLFALMIGTAVWWTQ